MSTQDQRPLSPHLQVYNLPLTARLSISFRIAGVLLYLFMLVFIAWLGIMVFKGELADQMQAILSSAEGKVVLLLIVFTCYFHLANGVRHLFWDMLVGLEKGSLKLSGILVLVFAFVMTLVTWGLAS